MSHSAAVLHGFNKAGTCSVRRSHCAIEGLVHESGGWQGAGVSPQPHSSGSSGEQSRIDHGGVRGGGVTKVQPAAAACCRFYRSCFGIASLERSVCVGGGVLAKLTTPVSFSPVFTARLSALR